MSEYKRNILAKLYGYWKANPVGIAFALVCASVFIMAFTIAQGFYDDNQEEQARMEATADRREFVNQVLVSNCQGDRVQDQILLDLLNSVLEFDLPADADAEEILQRATFTRAQRRLEVRVQRDCNLVEIK